MFKLLYCIQVIEQCRKEGTETGVYFYHVADMIDPNAGSSLIKVTTTKTKQYGLYYQYNYNYQSD